MSSVRRYRDRRHAGEVIAEHLVALMNDDDGLVLALPRGGVAVAAPVAQRLGGELDIVLVGKLGVPGHEELAMGAIAEGGGQVLNDEVVSSLNLSEREIQKIAQQVAGELERRANAYRQGREPSSAPTRNVILVDDGLATGATMRAAIQTVHDQGARRITVAVPVGAPEVVRQMQHLVDQVVCPLQPPRLGGVGAWYDKFEQLTDDDVQNILQQHAGP